MEAIRLEAHDPASPLHENDIPPGTVYLSQAFPAAYPAEPARHVQGDAGLVFGENARLQRPDARVLRSLDQRAEERATHAFASRARGDIDADLRHAGVHRSGETGLRAVQPTIRSPCRAMSLGSGR